MAFSVSGVSFAFFIISLSETYKLKSCTVNSKHYETPNLPDLIQKRLNFQVYILKGIRKFDINHNYPTHGWVCFYINTAYRFDMRY